MSKFESSTVYHYHQQQPEQSVLSADRDGPTALAGRKSLSAIVRRFGRQTSMHGIPNAIRARSMTGKVVWCLVCLIAASSFAFQLTQLLRKYLSYPRKVVIEVLPLAAPFPSISLCNMRNLDTVVLNRLNRIFLQNDDIGSVMQQLSNLPSRNASSSASTDYVVHHNNYSHILSRTRRNFAANEKPQSSDDVVLNDWMKLMDKILWKLQKRSLKQQPLTRKPVSWASAAEESVVRQKGRAKQRKRRQLDKQIEEESEKDYVGAQSFNRAVNEFIRSYMTTVAKYYPMFELANQKMQNVFQSVLTRTTIATNMNRSTLTGAGVPFKEFVVTCRFSGEECNRTWDFTQFFDSYYYNCFTYRAPSGHVEGDDDSNSNLAEGLENGWSSVVLSGSSMLEQNVEEIRMIPGTHEYMSPMSSSEGVRVVIHPPDTEPYPHTEGFDVPPGYSATFGVKARKNIRIGPPVGNCSDNNPFSGDQYQYRLISCQKQSVVRVCGCRDISLPGQSRYTHLPFCADDSHIPEHCSHKATEDCFHALLEIYNRKQCVRNVTSRVARSTTAVRDICGCAAPCNEISYDVSYSLSHWPAESFDGDEAYTDIFLTSDYTARFSDPSDYEKVELYSTHFLESNRRVAMRDFVRLNVYVADGNVLKTEEQEDYVTSQLLADIGGQLGLWVGVSVITLAEILQLFFDFIHYAARIYGPYAQGREFRRSRSLERFSASHSVGGTSRPGPGTCQCGAVHCEAAERRVSLSLTSRRRRCTSCCDCACSRPVTAVGDVCHSAIPRSNTQI